MLPRSVGLNGFFSMLCIFVIGVLLSCGQVSARYHIQRITVDLEDADDITSSLLGTMEQEGEGGRKEMQFSPDESLSADLRYA